MKELNLVLLSYKLYTILSFNCSHNSLSFFFLHWQLSSTRVQSYTVDNLVIVVLVVDCYMYLSIYISIYLFLCIYLYNSLKLLMLSFCRVCIYSMLYSPTTNYILHGRTMRTLLLLLLLVLIDIWLCWYVLQNNNNGLYVGQWWCMCMPGEMNNVLSKWEPYKWQ